METNLYVHHETLASLVVDFPVAAEVFAKYKLDYCCGGSKTLEEACLDEGLNYETVLHELMAAKPSNGGQVLRMQEWSTPFLVDFIVENYHRYVRQTIPMIDVLLEKVCEAHALRHPALLVVKKQFDELSIELLEHMEKEEQILFPAIRKLAAQHAEDTDPLLIHLDKPVSVMLAEHQSAGDLLKAIRLNTNEYAPPSDACATFVLLYQKLKEFDDELIQHIHIENNILFKRIA